MFHLKKNVLGLSAVSVSQGSMSVAVVRRSWPTMSPSGACVDTCIPVFMQCASHKKTTTLERGIGFPEQDHRSLEKTLP